MSAEAGKTRELIERIDHWFAWGGSYGPAAIELLLSDCKAALEASLALVPAGGETLRYALNEARGMLRHVSLGVDGEPVDAGYQASWAKGLATIDAALAWSVVEPGGMREGWRWVPVEPTEKMLNDGRNYRHDWAARDSIASNERGELAGRYAAMLAAAPAPPALVPQQPAVAQKMDRSPQFMDGFRHASKRAVTWLHQRGRSMNDPHAKQVLDAAAYNLGNELAAPPSSERAGLETEVAAKVWAGGEICVSCYGAGEDDDGQRCVVCKGEGFLPPPATPPARSGLDPATIEAAAKIVAGVIAEVERVTPDYPILAGSGESRRRMEMLRALESDIRALAQEGS